ncbi:hypothetical protein HMPREF0208_00933 [Citrobacter koseri]|nr:hypothetical protein HMPREF3220_00224 [Citrobacter koseri]KXA04986.1 hypothetical protein HMPREF3207_01063 [Citrobacter koseri]KXB45960.1 hypothetical protein HMPREF0208_00933 [Citrobacter koseri]
MRAHFQPALARQLGGSLITGKIMAAINTAQRFVMRGLQSQFQPHFIALVFIFAEQIEHRIRYTVGARTDAQPDNAGLAYRLLIHRTQHLHFGKGTGVRLEIGQIAFGAIDQMRLMRQLFGNRAILLRLIGERGDITESTPATSDGAIAVWTAKSAVQRQFMNFLPITTRKIPTKHID